MQTGMIARTVQTTRSSLMSTRSEGGSDTKSATVPAYTLAEGSVFADEARSPNVVGAYVELSVSVPNPACKEREGTSTSAQFMGTTVVV